MITFYKADETDFDNNGLGVLDRDIQNPDIEEKLNDIFTFSFNYPIFAVNGARLAARMIVKADDPENSGQLFRILKLSKSNGMLTAFCYHIFYDLNGNEIPDTNIVGQNGQTAITQMLSKTAVAHKFQGFSDIAETANIRVVRMSPVKFLIDPQTDNNFINRLGGEIRRVNYRIWMNKVRGTDNGATIRWKKSLDSYNATWDYTTIATRIRPVGYNGIMLPESYVDSPLIDKYETIVIKEIQYSDIKAIDPNATSNDETAVPLEQAYELLRQAAAKEFSENNLDKPTVTLSVNMVALRNMDEYKDVKSLETINPWDTVTVINERDGLSVKVRLNHYHWNPVTHKFISMELGNSKSTFTDIGSKVDHATNIANQANDTANHASASADGKNTIYRNVKHEDIVNPVNGDTCFEKNGDKEEIWIYNGKSVPPSWELIVDDATGEEVRQNVDAAQKEAEEAKKKANESVATANDAVAKAGFANDTAEEAKSDAASALQKAIDAYTHGDQIKTGLTADIDAVKGQVSLKANQVDVDKLGGRVTNAEAQIKLQADQIALTVSKTELTNILGDYATETWTQSQIKSTADQINLSVSKVQSNLDNMQVAGVNYLRNSNFEFGNANWRVWSPSTPPTGSTVEFQKAGGDWPQGTKGIVKIVRPTAHANNSYGIAQDGISIVQGREYVVSFESASTIDMTFSVGDSGNGFPFQWFHVHALSHQRTQIVFKAPAGATKCNVYFGFNGNDKGTLWISRIMMSQGNKSLDWGVNPADYTSEVQFSQLQVTVNGIQGTVQNKADKSQVTQLANQITSTVSQLGTPNYVYNPGFAGNSADGWGLGGVYYMSNNAASSKDGVTALGINLKNIGTTGTKTFKTAISKRMPYSGDLSQPISASVNIRTYEITGDVRFFFTIETFADLTSGRVEYFDSNEITGAQSGWRTSAKLNAKPTKPFKYVAIAYQIAFHGVGSAHGMFCKPMMNFGPTVAPYTDSGISASQITQLSNDINLRVEKNKIVNQINISPEGILIDGKKVHITGQTSIDKAVIKDAMIADIKADKITAGTLNAAHVNVINLNANNITTGTIKGADLSMNLNTGEVVFQHGRIHSASNNVDINIDQGYLSVANANTRVLLKDGGIQFVQPTIFDHQTNPYLDISNSGGAQSFYGASIVGRDFLSLANSANNTNMFTYPLGVETFAGISFGNANGRWNPTKIGGAERGIVLSAGTGMPSDMFGSSPSIIVGANESRVAGGNRIALDGEYVHIPSAYSKTASGSANVIVATDGALVRSTSATKYKTDIIRTNKSDYGDKLLNLPTATWMDLADIDRYEKDPVKQPKPTRNFGMIAEDLADVGLEMLVVRGTDGELEGINYDRIGPALIPVIAKLKNEVGTLKRKLEEKTA